MEQLKRVSWYGSCIPSYVLRLCTLQETNISHLGKRNIIDSKVPFIGDMLVPRRVIHVPFLFVEPFSHFNAETDVK